MLLFCNRLPCYINLDKNFQKFNIILWTSTRALIDSSIQKKLLEIKELNGNDNGNFTYVVTSNLNVLLMVLIKLKT